ncbi:MAG: APC family permease [Ferroplasma sp.]
MLENQRLKKNSLGTIRLIWQAMGTLSVAADAAYLLTGVVEFALGATPLAIALGLLAYLFIMNTGYQFSKHVNSAGSYYTFAGKGLGGIAGTFQAWNMAFYGVIGYGSFGFLGLAAFITLIDPTYSGILFWLPVAFLAALISFLFTHRGMKISTDYQIAGGIIEVAVLIIGSALIIVNAGKFNTLAVFTTKYINGVSQLLFAMIYSMILYFGTTVSITAMGEEAVSPEKTIKKALIGTVILSGITLIIVAYAFTIGWGPTAMASFATSHDPGVILFRRLNPVIYILLILVTVNSFMGYNISVSNADSRIFYSFARDGILFLPESIAKVHKKYKTPSNAALVIFIMSFLVAVFFGVMYGPVAGGLLMLLINAYAAYVEHIIASISLPVMMRRIGKFKLLEHLVIPVIGIVILLIIMVGTLASPGKYPDNIAVYIGVSWIPIAALLTFIEYKIHPENVKKAAVMSIEDESFESK